MNRPVRDSRIQPASLDGPDGTFLNGYITEELARRYPELENGRPLDSAEVAPPKGLFLIAYVDGQPAGCGAIRKLDGNGGVGEVKRMYVVSWARRRGVARSILSELEHMAKQWGLSSLILETGVRQPEAIAMYEASGFRRIPAFGPYVDSSVSVCFEKPLMD